MTPAQPAGYTEGRQSDEDTVLHQDLADFEGNCAYEGQDCSYLDLPRLAAAWGLELSRLPFSLRVLLENIVRHQPTQLAQTRTVFSAWLKERTSTAEIFYQPVRVLMQDFTGVPAIVDLAAMRDQVAEQGGDPSTVTPLSPVDLVIDHSVAVDHYGNAQAFARNIELEFARNRERYELLKWAQQSFDNVRVVPPGTGICHQVNLEYLAQVIWHERSKGYLCPDTLVGTDSHTTMINALGVLGWGVGGIEAEAAMLQQPISMLLPEVCGVKIHGALNEGVTATDLVLHIVAVLRRTGVVGKFVEYFGSGLDQLRLAERATIANMAPEYGATCGFFPVDRETLRYLALTGKSPAQLAMIEFACQAMGLWRKGEPDYSEVVEIDLGKIVPAIAGPKRPQDLITLPEVKQTFKAQLKDTFKVKQKHAGDVTHGSVVICAITSCTNTSNPSVMIAAGLVARKALAHGLQPQAWVKTSLAPGSQVVSEYLDASGLQPDLDAIGFHNVGYGCTTCIGNSGGLADGISELVNAHDLVVCSVLSGNRNFEGRINQDVRANFLASPPLVVVYALAGRIDIDFAREPLGTDSSGKEIFLQDIWPTSAEIDEVIAATVKPDLFKKRYRTVLQGSQEWQQIGSDKSVRYRWQADSTYIRQPDFFSSTPPADIDKARVLLQLGDSVTTDHISPAGAIKPDSPAGKYLQEHGVATHEFNSYGARRGNHEVMMRGTFANVRIKNLLLDNVEGGFTKHADSGEQLSVYEAAMRYRASHTPLLVVAGHNYGSGSSRDWAAKGPRLLGVRVVICASLERIHRSNLIGMGILPLEDHTQAITSQRLHGDEFFSFTGIADLQPQGKVTCTLQREGQAPQQVQLQCRIDTAKELQCYRQGGILPYVLRRFL